jgi:hypothetical protein
MRWVAVWLGGASLCSSPEPSANSWGATFQIVGHEWVAPAGSIQRSCAGVYVWLVIVSTAFNAVEWCIPLQ